MTLKTTSFDPAEYLQTEEDIIAYLDASMEGGDAEDIARAQEDVARSKGMSARRGMPIDSTAIRIVAP